VLGPEMRSTGEVMGLDADLGIAFAKTQMAAKPSLPLGGNVFVSIKDSDKHRAVEIVRQLQELGFSVYSTAGTAAYLAKKGLTVHLLNKIAEGRPHAVDMIKNGQLAMVINTPSGMIPRQDENLIRSVAWAHNVCIMTTLTGALAGLRGIRAMQQMRVGVRPLQDYKGNVTKV
jgi:carbamoyl-phosphate synthase large subunit